MDRLPVSLCMIVKDEEKNLEACLKSVQDWVAEMIVVDTGSTDRTVSIAEEMGARVEHYSWHDDFAAARNYALEFAQYPWILHLDADEEILPGSVQWFYDSYPWAGVEAYVMTIKNLMHKDFDEIQLSHEFTRFFRNKRGIRYVNRIHEYVDLSDRKIVRSPVYILHKGYGDPEAQQDRYRRNEKMLLRDIKENPESANTLAYLAQHYTSKKEYGKAAEYGFKAIENDVSTPMLVQASLRACCICAINLKKPAMMERIESLTDVDEFPELLFYRAKMLQKAYKREKAHQTFSQFIDVAMEMDEKLRQEKIISTVLAIACTHCASYHAEEDNMEEAITKLELAVNNAPTYYQARAMLGKYYFENNNFEKAHDTFETLIDQISKLGSDQLKSKVLPRYRDLIDKISKQINK